jgi:hypothetical protein
MTDEEHERLVDALMDRAVGDPGYVQALLRAALEFRDIEAALEDTSKADYWATVTAARRRIEESVW